MERIDVEKELAEAIERECAKIGHRRVALDLDDESDWYRYRREYNLADQRRKIADGPQICDCPYWGTEFNENA